MDFTKISNKLFLQIVKTCKICYTLVVVKSIIYHNSSLACFLELLSDDCSCSFELSAGELGLPAGSLEEASSALGKGNGSSVSESFLSSLSCLSFGSFSFSGFSVGFFLPSLGFDSSLAFSSWGLSPFLPSVLLSFPCFSFLASVLGLVVFEANK